MSQPATAELTTDEFVEAKLAASIRSNYLNLWPTSLGFAHLATIATVAVLWNHAPGGWLLVWAGVQSILMVASAILSNAVQPKRFLWTAIGGEAVCSVWFATLPLLALPESADWQVMQGLLLVALMLSTLGNTTASRGLHLAAAVPLAVVGAVVFTLRGTGAAQWVAAGFAMMHSAIASAT